MIASDERLPLLQDVSNSDEAKRLQRRMWRNIIVLNACYLLGNASFAGLTPIESSLNSDQGLGVISQAVKSAFNLLGSLLAGVAIRVLGCKRSIVVGLSLTAFVPLSNFYPTWVTLISGAIIGGMSSGVSMVAKKVYTSELAHRHSDVSEQRNARVDDNKSAIVKIDAKTNGFPEMGYTKDNVSKTNISKKLITVKMDENTNDVIEDNAEKSGIGKTEAATTSFSRARIQGFFFIILIASYKVGSIVGNLTSSLILGAGIKPSPEASTNSTLWFNSSTEVWPQCGSAYCNEDLGSDFHDVLDADRRRIYGFLGFCVGATLAGAVAIAMFLDDLEKINSAVRTVTSAENSSSNRSVLATFRDTIYVHLNTHLLLILPASLAMSIADSFWNADFTKAYITCPLGMEYIGYVLMWMGVTETVAVFTFGLMSSRRLRRGPMVVAPLVQVLMAVGLIYWTPDENSLIALCIYSAAWALSVGVRQVLLPALVGAIFRSQLEHAFSSIQMWSAVGSILAHAWSNWLCTDVKIFITIAFLVASVVAYVFLEVRLDVDSGRLRHDSNICSNSSNASAKK